VLRGSAGPGAVKVTRDWKNYKRNFKICMIHLNRVTIKGRKSGNYTSFEEVLYANEMLEERQKGEDLGVNEGKRRG
jgi:hypothetical protein